MSKPTHLDLCSGIGGFALAAAWAGYETVTFCEIDPFCQRVLRKHWPEVPIHDDVKTLSGFLVRSWTGGRAIDLITGGYPCQPFSLAGKRLGAEDDRHLWPYIAALVAELRPAQCLFENVAGHITLGLDRVLSDLEEIGYACWPVVIPACAVDAPHRRDRVWIVANAQGAGGQPIPGGVAGGAGSWIREARAIGFNGWPVEHQGIAPSSGSNVANATYRGIRRGRTPRQLGLTALMDEAPSDAGLEQLEGGGKDRATARATDGGLPPDAAERGDRRQTVVALGEPDDGIPGWMAGPVAFGRNWEEGVPRTTRHESNRKDKLMALGNAIVPAVAYEIIMAMNKR